MPVRNLKYAWRSLVRNKWNTFINSGGLILGFTIGLGVLLAVIYQLQFDKFHAKGGRIYQVYNEYYKPSGTEYGVQFGYPAGPVYLSDINAVEKMSRWVPGGSNLRFNEHESNLGVILVDTGFAAMFSFPAVKGSLAASLQQLNGLAITESAAKKVFGQEDPLGKKVQLSNGEVFLEHTVTAVLKDPPMQSSLRFDALARVENRSDYAQQKNKWDYQNQSVFVMLKPGASRGTAEKQLSELNHRIHAESYASMKQEGYLTNEQGDTYATKLRCLEELHFSKQIDDHGVAYTELAVVLGVGLMIILIACFNYININLAQAFIRAKEIGVRKCLGAGKSQLVRQLWTESFLVCCVAFVVSFAALQYLLDYFAARGNFNIAMKGMSMHPLFLGSALGLLVLVSLLAGGYPSWLMSRFPLVETLKGKLAMNGKHRLRNGLIVFQFVIACLMISCTLVIYRQFQHLQAADLGINKEYLISLPLQNGKKGRETISKLRSRLANFPGITSISGSSINLGRGRDGVSMKSSIGFSYKGKQIFTNIAQTDYDYSKTVGITLINGRDFDQSYASDTNHSVLIAESVAKQFGKDAVVGASILVDSAAPRWNIVGIFKDFHLYSMREEAQPLTLVMEPNSDINYCFVKTTAQRAKATMDQLQVVMKALEPDADFRGSFVAENIENWYKQEKTMSQMFSLAAIISVILSCTGLLAMVMQVTRQRVKEIGIRKVLGASTEQISWLVSRSFLKLVGLSVLIAIPVAWILMHQWLQSFPYHIRLEWWLFGLVALTAFVVALVTIAFNTWKAATQNPVKSIRTE
ncbi:FtsX-like permease family protein [Flavihumibacter petaseus]|uniref:Putative ABC transporter permease protein n=1 Tax=Flavihumibacter petaseus NBRC 106054 TaxID=1220578 RepID=A0A0E9MU09_9BACT|nr:FtsX-like permease family protein [Flavihumibacter petaseus]GAO41054.1 putative ABC transporter permease protein [Flavihumibacter petaseus NBRC 106054]